MSGKSGLVSLSAAGSLNPLSTVGFLGKQGDPEREDAIESSEYPRAWGLEVVVGWKEHRSRNEMSSFRPCCVCVPSWVPQDRPLPRTPALTPAFTRSLLSGCPHARFLPVPQTLLRLQTIHFVSLVPQPGRLPGLRLTVSVHLFSGLLLFRKQMVHPRE